MKLTDMMSPLATRARAIDFTALGMFLPNPDPILKSQGQDIRIYRELRTDAHIGGCIRRRKSAVKALQYGLDRKKSRSRIASNIDAIFADLDMERLIGEMLEAVLYGYQPLEINWGRVGNLLVPIDIVSKPPEWFCFDADNALRLKTKENMLQGELLPDRKFLLPRQDATYQNPYGFADLSMCFWPLVFKKGGVKFWLTFAEKFGTPFVQGKLPRGATVEDRNALTNNLEQMVQDAVAVIPDDASIEIIEAAGKSASADLYERLVMYCRSEISIAMTGTNQTVEAHSNRASATAGLEVAQDLRDGDAEIVAATYNQLIRWIVDLNWGKAEHPSFSFWDAKQEEKQQSERDKNVSDSGARFTNSYWMRAYGYQEGDLAAENDAPADSAPAPGATAQARHAAQSTAPAEQLADALQAQANPAWTAVLAHIQQLVDSADSLEALQETLLQSYGSLPTAELESIMASGFAVAQLAGLANAKEQA